MGCLVELAFAILGLLVILTYVGLTLIGAPPEKALLIATPGGIVVGILLSIAFRILGDAEEVMSAQVSDGADSPDAQPGDNQIKRGAD